MALDPGSCKAFGRVLRIHRVHVARAVTPSSLTQATVLSPGGLLPNVNFVPLPGAREGSVCKDISETSTPRVWELGGKKEDLREASEEFA